jgi:transposase
MNEYERRLAAIRRVQKGESVTHVCASLGRCRPWYYKWRQRFAKEGVAGLRDRRSENGPSRVTPKHLQQLIVEIRDRLVRQAKRGTYHGGIGAQAIQRELHVLEMEVPDHSTIYRILKDAGRPPSVAPPDGWAAVPTATQANDVHPMDLWPRVITEGAYLYIVHLVDVASWYVHGRVLTTKRTDKLLDFLVASWCHLGVAQVLQVDNEMMFTGGRWFSHLGRFVRLALLAGSEVWFNPFRHPGVQRLCGALPWPV